MSTRTINILTAVFVIILSFILMGQLEGVPREGKIFPSFLLYGLVFCSGLMIIRSILPGFKREEVVIFGNIPYVTWAVVVGLFVLYVVGIFNVGFFTTTFVISMTVTTVLSKSRWKQAFIVNLVFSAGITVFFYFVFGGLLNVPFPRGIFI